MPNLCDFTIKIKTDRSEKINDFVRWMKADYNYENEVVCEEDFHFFRVFSCYDSPIEKTKGGNYIAYLGGDCAWSVSSCMSEEGYYFEIKTKYPKKFKGITLQKASEILHCEIEVYSCEPGCCFAEHYYYKNGDVITSQVVDYQDLWFGGYNTKQEAEEDLCITLTDEEWEATEKVVCEWDFNNLEWGIVND